MNNSFFVFEGIDGSGKTTQIELLHERLEKEGFEVVRIREPGGTELSEEIREILLKNRKSALSDLSELLLFNAARAQLVQETIAPAIQAGKVVLGDRFAWSTLAYQGYGRGLPVESIQQILNLVCGDYWPSHTFYLDIAPSESRLRLETGRTTKDRLENEKVEFFEKVLNGYRQLALNNPEIITRYNASDSVQSLAHRIAEVALSKLTTR